MQTLDLSEVLVSKFLQDKSNKIAGKREKRNLNLPYFPLSEASATGAPPFPPAEHTSFNSGPDILL